MYIDDGYKCKECGKVYHANKYYLPKYCKKCGSQLVYKKGEWYDKEVNAIATPIKLRLTIIGWIEFSPNVKHPIINKLFKKHNNNTEIENQTIDPESENTFEHIGCSIIGKVIYINGEKVNQLPGNTDKIYVIQHNKKLYVNGYEYLDGVWKRTLKSLLIYLIR